MRQTAGVGRAAGSWRARRPRCPMAFDGSVAQALATAADTGTMPIPVTRLNHAVLFVRDAGRAAAFYARVFGVEPHAPRPARGSLGLYREPAKVVVIVTAGRAHEDRLAVELTSDLLEPEHAGVEGRRATSVADEEDGVFDTGHRDRHGASVRRRGKRLGNAAVKRHQAPRPARPPASSRSANSSRLSH